MQTPTVSSLLETLPKQRLVELGRQFGVGLGGSATKERQVTQLAQSDQVRIPQLLEWMGRDELRRACEKHGLDSSERARPVLVEQLLEASGATDSQRPRGLFGTRPFERHAPRVGDICRVRLRQYLVEAVTPPTNPTDATLVELVCLDDDNQGKRLQVLWELELGAQVQRPEADGFGRLERFDDPSFFGAYLRALRWNAVTATQADLFQSPFRAGIKLLSHQLVPLRKALSLPRANLFIADDVGLGKTIEAGLILQELELRQRVDFVLIVCPASICLQWKSEMEKRFGQRFEIYDRDFVARRRRQRGFGVQVWGTQNRFIISYQLLRRPEYFEPLLQHLGPRMKKSLLVLDEAHTAAPSTSTKYAVDSHTTDTVRQLAPRFENRLFLSATPHNGHSNSFSALMEILDPQRFTRGVKIAGPAALSAVMVRRLKRDLRAAHFGSFPVRRVIPLPLGGRPPEVELADKLHQYALLMKPQSGRGRLVFTNLQKRLLSSVDAFWRTLSVHAEQVAAGKFQAKAIDLPSPTDDSETEATDADEDLLDRSEDERVREATLALPTPTELARNLLDELLRESSRLRSRPDAKVERLLAWIDEHLRPGGSWNEKRVLIFTEYADTKRYLTRMLESAIPGAEDEGRVLGFHGAMSEEQRAEVQRAFNGDPAEHPVRVLIATDAAREGLNLQSHCADLFHFDVPWNPARMEQRNGRIDRTLQPSPEVRCHYFSYLERREDAVLAKLVEKVDRIQDELGSLGQVVLNQLEATLQRGIDEDTLARVDATEPEQAGRSVVSEELEPNRADLKGLLRETEESARILDRSKQVIDFDPDRLRATLDVGLRLAGAGPLTPVQDKQIRDQTVYELPDLPESWASTLDSLRPPRARDEPFWQWRKKRPQPVVFRPLDRMGDDRVHLHLEHPFVQRVLSRLRAQGTSALDLSRATILRNRHESTVRVVALGRVSLFGPGATRLHDELVVLSAPWRETGQDDHLVPDRDEKILGRVEELLAENPEPVPESVQRHALQSAARDFATLWSHVQVEADARAHAAGLKLTARGQEEAAQLRIILEAQKRAIEKELQGRQLDLFESELSTDEQRQWQLDKDHLAQRLRDIDAELEREPREIEALYQVSLKRLEPVGLVYLWPETRIG